MMQRLSIFVVAILILIWPLAPAQARQASRSSKDAPTMAVDFGYGQSFTMWPGRWAPITVHFTCGPKPFQGTLVINYPQAVSYTHLTLPTNREV